jgi:hypothetical protein
MKHDFDKILIKKWSKKWFFHLANFKKTKRLMHTIKFYRKNDFLSPKCSNHRQKYKNQGPKQTRKVLKNDEKVTQKHGQTSPFSTFFDEFMKNRPHFCYVLLSHGLHNFLQKFFFIKWPINSVLHNSRGPFWGQKRRFMTTRKWCRNSGPCRHYYIAKVDIL